MNHFDQEQLVSMIDNFITGICIFELKNKQLSPLYINDGLHRMLGYSVMELDRYLKNIRFSIIPDDLNVFEQAIADTLKADGAVDFEFRTVTGSGSVRWLQVRSNLYSKEGDRYVILCVIVDATERKNAEDELRIQAERMNLLTQTEKDKILDYNAKTDVMTLRYIEESGRSREEIIPDYIEKFDLGQLYPEDAELLLDVFRGLLLSPKNETIEVRSKRFSKEFIWNQLVLTSIAGMEGYVTRIVGRMIDINDRKLHEQDLENLANLDGLTQILNRSASERAINVAMSVPMTANRMHAFMIVDLDNFKSVNDCLGHSMGDKVLKECASLLMQNLRRADVVGRIGGDEFIVFAKDIDMVSDVDMLAAKLVEKLKWNLPYEQEEIYVSASIGIALVPFHGREYKTIFDRADEALYSVKANGKGGYRIYDSAATRATYHNNRSQQTMYRRENRMVSLTGDAEEMMVRVLAEHSHFQSALKAGLEMLVYHMGWQRGWICRTDQNKEGEEQYFSVCARGFETGELPEVSQFRTLWRSLYETKEEILMLHDYDLTDETMQRYFVERTIRRILYYPFHKNGCYAGCIVLEDCNSHEKELTEEERKHVKAGCRLLNACAVQFDLGFYTIPELVSALRTINDMDQYVYLIDTETYNLMFCNRKVLDSNPQICLGEPCYKTIKGRQTPCENCIMKKLDPADPHAGYSDEAFSYLIRKWTRQSVSWFDGNNNGHVCMITETDIPEYFIG